MVHKNCKVGKAKKVTVIELGSGDVIVSSISCKVDKYAGIAFVNTLPHEIGTKHNTAGCTTDDSQPEAVLIFTKIESIEVVERALEKAKILLRNIEL